MTPNPRATIIAAALACATTRICATAAPALTHVPAVSPLVRWTGRTYTPEASTSVYFDWEGVKATVAVVNYTTLLVDIADNCAGTAVGGGSRWAVFMTTAGANAAPAHHRIQTFYSGAAVSTYYLFVDQGGRCDPNCNLSGVGVFELVRLTESRLSGCGSAGNLSVSGFWTDGQFVAPPPASTRRLEFIGDSITAGDLNSGDGVPICGNAAFNNDITVSAGGYLCSPVTGLGADCMYTAWGGITLGNTESWGMSTLYPFTFSGSGVDAYMPWNFQAFEADAVVINLGTNDRPTPPAWAWIQVYVAFAETIARTHYNNPSLVLFLGYGPMTTEYEAFVLNVTQQLTLSGLRAYPLNLTLPHALTGCYGHPSAADNAEIAANVQPYIANIMGWSSTSV